MGILLHPTPPALPIATTYDLRWFAPLQGTLVLDALRWFAQHMDENGVVRTPTPARPSPLAMAFFHHGPLTFVLLPATRDPKGPVPLVIAAREPDGALRPFLWPFSCQSHVQRGVVDVLTQAFSMETAAHFATVLRAMARPARHADEASDRCPVLPWLLDGLASRTDGPQHLVLNKTLEGVLRTAWEWAGGSTKQRLSARVQTRDFSRKGSWSWEARLDPPPVTFDTGWVGASGNPLGMTRQKAAEAASYLFSHPSVVGDPATWYHRATQRDRIAIVWQGALTWDTLSNHQRLHDARVRTLLDAWNKEGS